MSPVRRTIMMYCQHSVGMGHLVRSMALAGGLARGHRVVFLSGGRVPAGMVIPTGVEVVALPPLGYDDDYMLVCREPGRTVEAVQHERRDLISRVLDETAPDAIIVELFPFGRRKFSFELLPLLERVESWGPDRPVMVCSVRDLLQRDRHDQLRHEERAARIANRHFDAVLVHADARFASFAESFRPVTPLTVPVHHTGFVTDASSVSQAAGGSGARFQTVVVSVGGGLVGGPLLHAAAAAQPAITEATGWMVKLVAGPFLPDEDLAELGRIVENGSGSGLSLERYVADLGREIANSAATVSQAGYNTTMDIVRSRTPALVVPYTEGRQDEQIRRSRRLEALGALMVLDPEHLSPSTLAEAVIALASFIPRVPELDLDGVANTVRIVEGLVARRDRSRSAAPTGIGVP